MFLLRARFASSDQIRRLFWGTLGEKACRRRLKQLTDAGILMHFTIPLKRGLGTFPHLFALTRIGQGMLLDELGEAADYPFPARFLQQYARPQKGLDNFPFLRHHLETVSLYLAFHLACTHWGYELEWLFEHELRSLRMIDKVELPTKSGNTEPYTLKPDAYAVITRPGNKRSSYFIELDRSTVTVKPTIWERRSWVRKASAYLQYIDSDACRERYGSTPPRVLTVTKGEARLQSLRDATITETKGGDQCFWFTTLPQALAETANTPTLLTAVIWQMADEEFGINDSDVEGDDSFKRFSLLAY